MPRRRAWRALALAAALTPARAPARAQQPSPDEPAVRAVEAARFATMTRGDLAALDRLLAAELVYAHTSGDVDTKATFLATLRSGALRYDSIAPDRVQVRIYGTTAVATGRSLMRIRTDGRTREFGIRFTEVYVKRGGNWLLVSWQSTRLP